jgi:hypothetical protein
MEFQEEIQGLQGLRSLVAGKSGRLLGGIWRKPVPIFLPSYMFPVQSGQSVPLKLSTLHCENAGS